jgi:hypothetical protein
LLRLGLANARGGVLGTQTAPLLLGHSRNTRRFFFPFFVENRGYAATQKLSFLNQHYQTDDDMKDPAVGFEIDSVGENSGFRVATVKRGKRDR